MTTQLDEQTRARLDSIVEAEVARGFRLREVPAPLRAMIAEAGYAAPERVRLSAVNPARRRDINSVVQQRFFKDLNDPDVLSDAQILALVEKRGEWNQEKKKRMEELQDRTVREMGRLWAEGFAPDTNAWASELVKNAIEFKEAIDTKTDATDEERAKLHLVFDRWVSYDPERQVEYNQRFAELQGREFYSVDADMAYLMENVPSMACIDKLTAMDDLKDKQTRLVKLNEERLELQELQLKHARIFAGSAESRQSHTEEMAQLYFTCDVVDADGKPKGKLAPTFDDLWNFPDEAIRWLLYESYFFHNEVPDEAREYLASWGFLRAEAQGPDSGVSAPSAESPAPPPSKTDTEPVATTDSASSA